MRLTFNNDDLQIVSSRKTFTRWMCHSCIHLRQADDFPPTCDAFPKGIPMDIVTGQFDHQGLHPSQKNKIVWEHKEGESL